MECKRHSIQYFIKSLMIFMLFEEKKIQITYETYFWEIVT